MKAKSAKCRILKNNRISDRVYKLEIAAPAIAKKAEPGQFVMAHLGDCSGVFLRRPFSIHSVRQEIGIIEILYEVVGKGTEVLSGEKSGAALDIIGPLGNGFDYQLPVTSYPLDFARGKHSPILLAGGIGVAPLIFLAEKLTEVKSLPHRRDSVIGKKLKSNILVLLGAKTKNHILCEKEFRRFGCDVRIATDDGSKGFKGFVTELLKELLKPQTANRKPILYACGPRPMLKAAAEFSRHNGIPAQVSLEEHMACGIGACLGCVVNTKQGYKRVCREGPVFNADEVAWEDK